MSKKHKHTSQYCTAFLFLLLWCSSKIAFYPLLCNAHIPGFFSLSVKPMTEPMTWRLHHFFWSSYPHLSSFIQEESIFVYVIKSDFPPTTHLNTHPGLPDCLNTCRWYLMLVIPRKMHQRHHCHLIWGHCLSKDSSLSRNCQVCIRPFASSITNVIIDIIIL